MRHIITLAVLLVFAAPVALDAQDAADIASPDGDVHAEMVQSQGDADLRADDREAELELIEAEVVETTQDQEAPQAVAQPERTQWWWLIGAIVVAGIILAVIL